MIDWSCSRQNIKNGWEHSPNSNKSDVQIVFKTKNGTNGTELHWQRILSLRAKYVTVHYRMHHYIN